MFACVRVHVYVYMCVCQERPSFPPRKYFRYLRPFVRNVRERE